MLEVIGFVVRDFVTPEPGDDADPFKCQGAQDRVVSVAGSFPLFVKFARPTGASERVISKFQPALMEEERAGATEAN
jgi:hypothetical protein